MMDNKDEVVGYIKSNDGIVLSNQEKMVLEEMNDGIYLIRTATAEGVGWHETIKTNVRTGTIKNLVDFGLIQPSTVVNSYSKYILTDKGRQFKRK